MHVGFTGRRSLLTMRQALAFLALATAVGCAPLRNFRERWASRHHTAPAVTWREAVPPIIPPPPATPASPELVRRERTGNWQIAGHSERGEAIELARIGNGTLRVLVIGTVHGDEPEGVALAEQLAHELWARPELAIGATVLIVRNANPDGTAARTRTNANGVDLNRNFPAANWKALAKSPRGSSGDTPGTENETQVLLGLIHQFRPDRIIAIHSTRGKPMNNYDGPARDLAEAMAQFNRYAVSDTIGYPTPGSLGSYAGIDMQIPIVTLELPRGIAPETAWQQNRDALLKAAR